MLLYEDQQERISTCIWGWPEAAFRRCLPVLHLSVSGVLHAVVQLSPVKILPLLQLLAAVSGGAFTGLEARTFDGTANRAVTATKRRNFGEFIFLLSCDVSPTRTRQVCQAWVRLAVFQFSLAQRLAVLMARPPRPRPQKGRILESFYSS
jgi:hypothetical protein